MSFGWAVCPRDGETSLLLFRAADERLYAQKLIRSRLTSAEVVGDAVAGRAAREALRDRLGAQAQGSWAQYLGRSCRGRWWPARV